MTYAKVNDAYGSSEWAPPQGVPPYQQAAGGQPYAQYGAPSYPPQGYPTSYSQQPQPAYGQPPQAPYGQAPYAQPAPYTTPYNAPSYPPPANPPPPQSVGNSGEKFNKEPKYKDLWATVLFLLTLLGFAATAVIGIKNIHLSSGNSPENQPNNGSNNNFVVPPPKDIAGILISVVGGGFLISAVYFLLMQKFAGKLIKVSMVLTILVMVALGAYYIVAGSTAGGIIVFLIAGLYAFFLWSWRSRIPFAKVLLKTVTSITGQYPATLFVGFVGLILETAFTALWIASFAGMMQYFDSDKASNGLRYVTVVFMLFALYYVTQVISNTIHVTISGLFATYYFMGTRQPDGKVTVPVRNPTASSAKRAVTTSFGPVCFGSLIIALIQTIRALLRMASQSAAEDGNIAGALCAACAGCFLSCIEGLVEYFNKYAFVQVAVYGKDYIRAAKDTWELCKSRGIDAIINDSLVGSVLTIGGLLVGFICGFVAYLYVRFSPNIPSDGLHYGVFIAVAILIGMSEFFVLSTVIDSGVTTTFVCLAEDPAALYRTKPELYERIRQVYPQIAFPV
ncbi:uncharacterized protein SPPG_00024 [Spizellomyces punctatus DAOM BR117]|uniref:Protein PNS1 n=1 Tax=Spizellomyces punctatus (strain DAOM BR117) TaxID=645134 RepID=A0A0L0HTU3_SPIPD|nr:uncharacterized protein SPPG_00024 [Spizellomyces punctatus DAOM BR117]KND04289.1 hypothetical protein SPPG_00024 [Spizellomyces punctatus DAOM BR117]|eukprot:XP_016612328.1 hypothetical protein SPPG_00024 [Spizellomyces punctatus DAOM BR117]